ncbi:D-alanyl-D-alanine carboxypeptidase [uncultured Arcticibacterium sp.]|uniref:D-alanyl-D-alanine carboxypeptidase n=1 Tax=uncultured Arcticibacterium sp. TaxID=2173042 RepID=UPI0030FC0B4E
MKNTLVSLLLIALLGACQVQKITNNIISPNDVCHHLGYLFIDTVTGDTLFQQNAGKYFSPASTTKLFTWYSSISLLGEQIPALKYYETPDTLFFWGTGDPTFLRKDFLENKTLEFLESKTDKKLVFSNANFQDKHFGQGWMWDDYLEAYQAEVSALPMYGNLVTFDQGSTEPPYFKTFTQNVGNQKAKILRADAENYFTYADSTRLNNLKIPFKTDGETIAALLSDTLKVSVIYQAKHIYNYQTTTLFSESRDSLIIPMLEHSDNMLAEQLMLMASGQISDSLSVKAAITYMLENKLADLPQKPRWVDGSGLSRYNIFTPNDLVFLLQKIKNEIGLSQTFYILPKIGQNQEIYIWAKSGSMSGVYNLAGFIKTKKGRTLTFALMNNNFTKPVSAVRKEMASFLEGVREGY